MYLRSQYAEKDTSMGMHEGQSRFFENMIGKRKSFWEPVYPRLEEAMPDKLSNVSLDMFMDAVNRVNPGPIRTVSDELTYPLHIIIRYELEKKLISGTIDVEELPDEWNKRYKKYLELRRRMMQKDVLQDVHWRRGIWLFPIVSDWKRGSCTDILSY